ncbi:hypothetical protein MRX96_053705 [Rhipicephalus microplus]
MHIHSMKIELLYADLRKENDPIVAFEKTNGICISVRHFWGDEKTAAKLTQGRRACLDAGDVDGGEEAQAVVPLHRGGQRSQRAEERSPQTRRRRTWYAVRICAKEH